MRARLVCEHRAARTLFFGLAAQFVLIAHPLPRGLRRALGARRALLQAPQRYLDRRALGADVLRDRALEAVERTDRRVFLRATVERARERGADRVGARRVDLDLALAHATGVDEHLERHAEVHEPRRDGLAVDDVAGHVFAVAVAHADRAPVVELARDLVLAPAFEAVADQRPVAAAVPRAVRVALAPRAVQRRGDRGREGRLPCLVRPEHHRQQRVERERALAPFAEAVDLDVEDLHGTTSSPSNAASA